MGIYNVNDIYELIKDNPYVGRGIVIGTSEDGKNAVSAYFIMGRSANSRNRVFTLKDGALFTEPFDMAKVQDPSLIIYAAAREYKNHFILTNGNQTDTIYDALKVGGSFEGALDTREFEPDKPNYTPRISGILNFENGSFSYKLNILKAIDEDASDCVRYTFSYPAKKGLGHFLHTYVTDGNPIPSFQGEPERVFIPSDINEFTDKLWNGLNADNKISLYVRYTNLETGKVTEKIVNKNI